MGPEVHVVSEVSQPLQELEGVSHQSERDPEEDGYLEEQPRILAELVIEEVGIDGMCGVY
jgi:mycofactocin precursor